MSHIAGSTVRGGGLSLSDTYLHCVNSKIWLRGR